MANNFSITGDGYVSKAGSDNWDGASKDTPKVTISAGLSSIGNYHTLIVGSGLYQESLNWGGGKSLIGDGLVKCMGNGSNSITLSTGGPVTLTNLLIENYATFNNANPFTLTFTDCIIKSTVFTGNSSSMVFNNCILIDCDLSNSGAGSIIMKGCILINTQISVLIEFKNSYADAGSQLSALSNTNGNNFNYNNIQGSIGSAGASGVTSGVIQDISGAYYDLSLTGTGGTGTQTDPYHRDNTSNALFYLDAFKIAYPVLNTHSFSADPKFNNPSLEDYTLQADSPNIAAGDTGLNNIGPTDYAKAFYAGSSNELLTANGATISNLSGTTDMEVASGQTSGYIISAPVYVSSQVDALKSIGYVGNLAFDKSAAGGTATNKNVPDGVVYKTIVRSGNTTSGSAVITGLSQTSDLVAGMALSGANIPGNTTIVSVDSASQVTVSANATATGTDSLTFVPAGSNPDRLVFEMRWSTQDNAPASDAEWDNQGYGTAGDYFPFIWNQQPKIDINGNSSGNPAFDFGNLENSQPVGAKWIQVKITLTNDYSN